MLTDELTQELLRDHTPEQLAVIAAQHMIYVSELKAKLGALETLTQSQSELIQKLDLQLLTEVSKNGVLTRDAVQFAKNAIDAYPKHVSKIATDNRHKANRERRADALKKWDASALTNASEFARRHHQEYGVTERVMCAWISKHKSQKTAP